MGEAIGKEVLLSPSYMEGDIEVHKMTRMSIQFGYTYEKYCLVVVKDLY